MKTVTSLKILSLTFFLLANTSYSQDIDFARSLIDTLASPKMEGRGYVHNGDIKAAGFLERKFTELGLLSFSQDYLQPYSFPMNTFPGEMEASVNGIKIKAGSDFQVWAATPAVKGTFKVVALRAKTLLNPSKFKRFAARNYQDKFLLIDKKGISNKKSLAILDSLKFFNFLHARGLIFISDSKLAWSVMVGSSVRNYVVVDIKRDVLPRHLKIFSLEVESEFEPEHKVANIIGWVKGQAQPDTFLVFTAHFDHLGRLGREVYYPGANDNASGTAMVTDLARHYSLPENQPEYSIAFVLLSGEEAGLQGANFCADHPPFALKNIKFLINLDMVGTGSEGITMVNGTVFKEAYEKMVKINADNEYVLTVKSRGESCNSDHCPFYKKGVPSVFVYSMGKEFTEYHNIDDRSDKLPLSEYNDIFRLVRDFMDSFAK